MTDEFIDRLDEEEYIFRFGGEKSYKVYPKTDIPINEHELDKEFIKQASLYAYIAVLKAKADSYVKQMKVAVEEKESELYEKFINAAVVGGNKKPTESALQARVTNSLDVKLCKTVYLNAQSQYALLSALEEAIKMRSEMLIRKGAMLRTEWEQTGMQTPKRNSNIESMKDKLRNKQSNSQ